MADWAIYWAWYRGESGADGEPVNGWLTSRDWLIDRLNHGDRIWLFIAGDACGRTTDAHKAHLAQLLVVDRTGNNPDHDPDDKGSAHFRIEGIEDRCVLVEPPLLVDDLLRRAGGDTDQHIGVARQTPFELETTQADAILSRLRPNYPDVYTAATRP